MQKNSSKTSIAGPLLVSCFGNKELHTWMCRKRGFQSSGWMWYIAQWKSGQLSSLIERRQDSSKIQPMGHSQSAHWLLYKDHFSSRQASCQAHTKSEPVENTADYCYCLHFYKKYIYFCVFIYLANLIYTFFYSAESSCSLNLTACDDNTLAIELWLLKSILKAGIHYMMLAQILALICSRTSQLQLPKVRDRLQILIVRVDMIFTEKHVVYDGHCLFFCFLV